MTERQWPAADWSAEPWAHVAETHSAVVFFVGDRACKLKKPVSLGFLDFSAVGHSGMLSRTNDTTGRCLHS